MAYRSNLAITQYPSLSIENTQTKQGSKTKQYSGKEEKKQRRTNRPR